MDYRSFQPGNLNQNQPAQVPEQTSLSQKTFTPKFVGMVVLILVLGGAAYGGMWYWQKQSLEIVVPTFTPRDEITQFCGGIAGIQCPKGYSCQLNGNYPDAGGTCARDNVICIQVITMARDPKTGKVVDFPTPCDVPEGWQKI